MKQLRKINHADKHEFKSASPQPSKEKEVNINIVHTSIVNINE
jgi:hypothetical protein